MPLAGERNFLSAMQPGILEPTAAGNGRTWAGLLRDVTKVAINSFQCPADVRLNEPSAAGFLVPPPAGSGLEDPLYFFSYCTPYVGYSNTTAPRRMPWSVTHFSTNDVVKGNMPRAKLVRASDVHLVWDGYNSYLSTGAGYAPTPTTGLKATLKIAAENTGSPNVRINVFRHTLHKGNILTRGPNSLFADGHAEQTIDPFVLTEDNFNYPK